MSLPDQVDRSPQAQLNRCIEVGMDCLDLVLSHNDMGPKNVIVDLARESIGITEERVKSRDPQCQDNSSTIT